MWMDYEDRRFPEPPALGYSWPHPGLITGTIHGDARVRVHPECLDSRDRPDVKIVQIPSHYNDLPRCSRCHGPLKR